MPNNSGNKQGGGRGFAGMDGARQREIASKGGEAVSQDRVHMAEIGRKGGEAVSENREHMAEIGRKGGEARGHSGQGGGPRGLALDEVQPREVDKGGEASGGGSRADNH